MSVVELESWLSKVKELSVSELLTVQERVTQELKTKTSSLENPNDDAATITDADLPPELVQELTELSSLNDKALLKAARNHLPAKDAQRLRQLNHKQQKYGRSSLTQAESRELEDLGYQYDRHILLRSQAIVLLKERGYDISKLLKAS